MTLFRSCYGNPEAGKKLREKCESDSEKVRGRETGGGGGGGGWGGGGGGGGGGKKIIEGRGLRSRNPCRGWGDGERTLASPRGLTDYHRKELVPSSMVTSTCAP